MLAHRTLAMLVLAAATQVSEAAFQTLPTTGATVNGSANELFDPLRINPGTLVNPSVPPPHNNLDAYALPSQFTVINQRASDILLDGSAIGQTPGVDYVVGTLRDYVMRDTSVSGANRLVFALRAVLNNTVAGVQNVYEINNLLRSGYNGFAIEAAWSRGSDRDLRLYNAARTATLFGQGTRTYDPDVVLMQSDINVSEGNPWSGWFYLRTNAPYCTTAASALRLYQAGEEGQPVVLETLSGFRPLAAIDTDSDGIVDGLEDANCNAVFDNGETRPALIDTDSDGLQDGTETGVTAPAPDPDGAGPLSGTKVALFVADADAAATSSPRDADHDDDGLADGIEDGNRNGRFDAGESRADALDTDGDGIRDGVEAGVTTALADPDGAGPLSGTTLAGFVADSDPGTTTLRWDLDTDDDGLADGVEDANRNGRIDAGETDPNRADSDSDGVQDGTEKGLATGVADPDGAGPLVATTLASFVADQNPATTTDALNPDSDGDTLSDGAEDSNGNGVVDIGESDPGDPASPAATRTVPLPPAALAALAVPLAALARRQLRAG